jgi:hypothetical protein
VEYIMEVCAASALIDTIQIGLLANAAVLTGFIFYKIKTQKKEKKIEQKG